MTVERRSLHLSTPVGSIFVTAPDDETSCDEMSCWMELHELVATWLSEEDREQQGTPTVE